MSSAGKKSKSKKIIKVILIIILVLLLVIFFGINGYVEGIIKNKVDTELNKNPKSLYHITYEDLSLNILTGSVAIKNITITPTDSARQLVNKGLMRSIVHSQIEQFKVKRLKIFDFINDKNVDIKKVIVKNTKTEYMFNPDVEKPENKKEEPSDKLFPNSLNRVSIGDFEFINSTFLLSNNQQKDEYLFEIDSLSIIVKDVFIDSSTVGNPIPLNFSDISINTKHFGLKSMKYYSISTSGISFNAQDTSMTLHQFKLTPKYSRAEFNKMIQYNDDLFSVSTEKVVLNGLGMNELESKDFIDLNSVIVYEPQVSIYRDKRLPDAPFKKKKLITSAIKSITVPIYIDSIKVLNAKLTYEEMHGSLDYPGKVFFEALFLKAHNLTNDSILIAQDPHFIVEATGKIMGKSEVNAHFDFNLQRSDDYFTARGNLKTISGTEFNRMVGPLMMVEVQSGDVHRAAFYFSATDDASQGSLDLVYENLKVEVLKQKDPTKKAKAWSWIANEFVIKNNTPDTPKYRTGIIGFERRKDKAIVNFLWNSVKTGIISTIAPIADKNRKAVKKEEKEAAKKAKKEKRKSKKTDAKNQ